LICPTSFVQQLNTLSALTNGRFSLNIVAGHSPEEQRYYGDFLDHDERYRRTAEFLAVCHQFWRSDGLVNFKGEYYRVENGRLNTPFCGGREFPEIFIAGGSDAARCLAIRHGTCWMRLGDTPQRVAESVRPVLDAGKEAGLRLAVIVRPTHEEAVVAAHQLVAGLDPALEERARERTFTQKTDSVSMRETHALAESEWLTPWLWMGAVRTHGAAAVTLVGTPEEIASALMEYKRAGISQFILSGWPKLQEMIYFSREVLPLVRQKEREACG
jgi:alkanesulfonate monooxygenase